MARAREGVPEVLDLSVTSLSLVRGLFSTNMAVRSGLTRLGKGRINKGASETNEAVLYIVACLCCPRK
jgi:hypothetical protein